MVGSYVQVVGSMIVVHERDSRDCKSGVNEMIYTSTESH
jgi:hypothetical protein